MEVEEEVDQIREEGQDDIVCENYADVGSDAHSENEDMYTDTGGVSTESNKDNEEENESEGSTSEDELENMVRRSNRNAIPRRIYTYHELGKPPTFD